MVCIVASLPLETGLRARNTLSSLEGLETAMREEGRPTPELRRGRRCHAIDSFVIGKDSHNDEKK